MSPSCYVVSFSMSRQARCLNDTRSHLRLWLAMAIFYAEPAPAGNLDAKSINEAQWSEKREGGSNATVLKLQVLLDRARFSPGEIDGKFGENVEKAITAYASAQVLDPTKGMTDDLWKALTSSGEPVIKEYTISEADVKGPFLEKIPAKMDDMKDLPALSYRSPREKLAEQFHMSEELLSALNPGQRFDKPGTTILVANVSNQSLSKKAARIVVDKVEQTLRVYDKSKGLIAFYPVTVGSTEKPAPDGQLKVISVARNPTYRYNPEYAFKGVKSKEPFIIRPGPNNPVGAVWIGLSMRGYGIHGTAEPGKVSKSESHGCVRLTNWDALQLASIVAKGVIVEFQEAGTSHKPRE